MMIQRRSRVLAALAIVALAVAAFAAPRTALAISTTANIRNVPYTTTFGPSNSMRIPFTGTMRLNFHNGYISGWYNDTSIRPGSPFRHSATMSVQGSVTPDGHIHFLIGKYSFVGTLHEHVIQCSTFVRGTSYAFVAHQQ
jgi:hypothetical protein